MPEPDVPSYGVIPGRLPVPAAPVPERRQNQEKHKDGGDLVTAVDDRDAGEDAEADVGVGEGGEAGPPPAGHEYQDGHG